MAKHKHTIDISDMKDIITEIEEYDLHWRDLVEESMDKEYGVFNRQKLHNIVNGVIQNPVWRERFMKHAQELLDKYKSQESNL